MVTSDVVTTIKEIETVRIDTVLKVVESVPIPEPIETIRYKTVTVEVKSVPDTIVRYIKQPIKLSAKIPIRLYRDSIDLEDFRLFYEHEIAGTLEDSKYKFEYFEKTITKEIERTIETTKIKKNYFSLYAVGGYDLNQNNVRVGGDLIFNKYKVGYRFGVDKDLNHFHGVEVGIKLLSL